MPILPTQGRNTRLLTETEKQVSGQLSFQAYLQSAREKQSQDVTFSSHAQSRLQERNINLSAEDLDRLNSTIDKLAKKGARESLVYMQEVALVVSVANRTVITALNKLQGADNIITNIDSAAII
ncbi:MAG: hypothetical protein IIY91_04340 [Selenomonas sp.]|nr:hypothetical protein [Selenomonas sp.]